MGMFDTIKCGYDLGPGFYNKELQTKDIECMMMSLWLDPSGKLWLIDYSGTQDFEITKDATVPWDRFKAVPNGNKGKVTPYYLTRDIIVYPSKWDAHYVPYPECEITFLRGTIEAVTHVKKYNAKNVETLGESIRTERR